MAFLARGTDLALPMTSSESTFFIACSLISTSTSFQVSLVYSSSVSDSNVDWDEVRTTDGMLTNELSLNRGFFVEAASGVDEFPSMDFTSDKALVHCTRSIEWSDDDKQMGPVDNAPIEPVNGT